MKRVKKTTKRDQLSSGELLRLFTSTVSIENLRKKEFQDCYNLIMEGVNRGESVPLFAYDRSERELFGFCLGYYPPILEGEDKFKNTYMKRCDYIDSLPEIDCIIVDVRSDLLLKPFKYLFKTGDITRIPKP